MQFASLGSGSKGNGTLIKYGAECLLIDCGFSLRETEKRLARLNIQGSDISAVLVTHEHSDHLRGVMPLARKYQLNVYLTAGTATRMDSVTRVKIIRDEESFKVGQFKVTPVAVPHDAKEPVQFVIDCSGKKLGILTDLGCITPHVVEHYHRCDGLVLEANHDLDMLRNGSYPTSLKRRVGSDWGHLNNGQALSLLNNIQLDSMQQLVLAHISQENNHLEIVQNLFENIEAKLPNTHYACQQQGFGWLSLQ